MFVPLFNRIAINIENKNKNGSTYDSHMNNNIIITPDTATTSIHVGNTTSFSSAISPSVFMS